MAEPAAQTRRSRGKVVAVAAALALGLGALALYGIAGGDKAAACSASPATLEKMKSAAIGEVAGVVTPSSPRAMPALAFKDANGADVTLDRFKGKVTLLNLWATWCAPCRKEMPALDELKGEKGGDKFDVVTLSLDLGISSKPQAFLKEIGAKHLELYVDPTGKALQALRAVGRGTGLPTTLLLDKAGCEIGYLPGPAEWASADAKKLIDAAIAD